MDRTSFLPAYLGFLTGLFVLALGAESGMIPAELLLWTRILLNLGFIVLALVPVRGYTLAVTLACLAAALGIALLYKVPVAQLAESFNSSSNIIAFFAVIPAIAIPIRFGGYIDAMESFLAERKGRRVSGFLLLVGLQLLLSIVLNIGSIPVMQKLLAKSNLPKKYRSLMYSSAYSIQMVVSPFDGVVNALILSAGTSYAAYAGHGLIMGLGIAATGLVLLLSDKPLLAELTSPKPLLPPPVLEDQVTSYTSALSVTEAAAKIRELTVNIIFMIGFSVLAGQLLDLDNPAMGTAMIILAYSCIWTLLLGLPFTSFATSGKEYALTLAGFRGFIPFLVSASFLGAMSAHSPIRDAIGGLLSSLDMFPRYFLIQGIMILTTLLCMVGVHMMITVAAIGAALVPSALGLSAPGFALMLLSCWFIAMNASPFVPFSVIVGEAINERPTTVALRYNLRLSAIMILFGPLLIR